MGKNDDNPEIEIHETDKTARSLTAFANGQLYRLVANGAKQPTTEVYVCGPDGDEPELIHVAKRAVQPASLAIESMKEALQQLK